MSCTLSTNLNRTPVALSRGPGLPRTAIRRKPGDGSACGPGPRLKAGVTAGAEEERGYPVRVMADFLWREPFFDLNASIGSGHLAGVHQGLSGQIADVGFG